MRTTAFYNPYAGLTENTTVEYVNVIHSGELVSFVTDGNDAFAFNSQNISTSINEVGGNDAIWLAGVTENDVRFEKLGNLDLKIHVGTGSITINNQFKSEHYVNNDYDVNQVEKLVLDNGVEFDLLHNLTFTGTAGLDFIHGTNTDSTLIGLAGDDALYGHDANDTYIWSVGDGNDTLTERNGLDQIILHNVQETDIRFERSGSFDLKLGAVPDNA